MKDSDLLAISTVKPINKDKDSIIITKVVIHYMKREDSEEEEVAQLYGFRTQLFEGQILEIKPHFMQFQNGEKENEKSI